MPDSIASAEFRAVLRRAGERRSFRSPEDWRDQWIYFLMVDRFHNPDFPPNHAPWDTYSNQFQGGTLEGVRERLDYLAELGAGAIWLSPVFKNCRYDEYTYHGYGFQDLLRVDPRFGTEAELEHLVEDAHARGLYVILDIVLNHAGDVFEYVDHGSSADYSKDEYPIRWRDEYGTARADWAEAPPVCSRDAAVWPVELRSNAAFRRHGKAGAGRGDFESLKGVLSESPGVRSALISACQYAIARYDVDGFRIDTLKYLERETARVFGNAVREFALSIGKKNFFTFGEVWDSEEMVAKYVGRSSGDADEMVGVDAALDFPQFYKLPGVVKGLVAPGELAGMYANRKRVEQGYLSSHGEAGRYFVTFLDNHDQHSRFYYSSSEEPHRYDAQVTMGLAALFALQGIPCVYYGTEQGLSGSGWDPENVREALWGKPNAFDATHPFYQALRALGRVRRETPALRYGRQYFREVSGNGVDFSLSGFAPGILAFSRVLNDAEVLVVANTQSEAEWSGWAVVDASLHPEGAPFELLFSNQVECARAPGSASTRPSGAKAVPVHLRPMELQMVRRAAAMA